MGEPFYHNYARSWSAWRRLNFDRGLSSTIWRGFVDLCDNGAIGGGAEENDSRILSAA